MSSINIPEIVKPVLLFSGAANAVDCDWISCKNVNKVWFLIFHAGSNDTDLTLQLSEATAVAGTSAQDVTVACPIWRDNDAGTTSDTYARSTDDDNIVIDPATQNPVMAVIEWDPAKFSAGFDCITLADSGGHASNTVRIFALCEMKNQTQAANTASVIID